MARGAKTGTIASFRSGDQIYLACDGKGVLAWSSKQAAIRWLKRFYTSMAKGNALMARKHYDDVDFRVHSIRPEVLSSDTFEQAVVKPAEDAGRVYKADEYDITFVQDARFQGIACSGNKAESWHNNGIRPSYPTKI